MMAPKRGPPFATPETIAMISPDAASQMRKSMPINSRCAACEQWRGAAFQLPMPDRTPPFSRDATDRPRLRRRLARSARAPKHLTAAIKAQWI